MSIDLFPGALEAPAGPDQIDVWESASSEYSTSEGVNTTEYTWTVDPETAYTDLEVNMNNIIVTWAEDYKGPVAINVFGVNDCGDGPVSDNFEVTVANTFSINENDLNVGVSIFPNPNNGTFTIKLSAENNETLRMQIRSIVGEVVLSEEEITVNGELTKQLDISKFAEGIYFLVLENNNTVVTEKIVIQK